MDNSNVNKDTPKKSPKLWGTIYIIFGMMGLASALYLIMHSEEIGPMLPTILAGSLLGALSIVAIVFGYRVMNKDF
jgi:hypothetical protein